MIFINQLISAIIQIIILTVIPFIFYLITHRSAKGFWKWLGFTRAEKIPLKNVVAIFFGFLAVVFIPYIWLYNDGALSYTGFTIDSYKESGWSLQTIATVLVWAIIQTSLSEEIFFRGFLGKRLSHKFGWKIGTSVQAIIFGSLHIMSVWGHGILPAVIVFMLTGGIGFMLGWLSMRKSDESIIYGWSIHAMVNIVSSIIVFTFLL